MVMSMGAKEENVCSERNNGLEFETRMKNIYASYFGFEKVETTQQSGDGGIDLVMFIKENGIQKKCFAQCKEWYSKNVGRIDLQAFVGACTEHENNNGKLLLFFDTTSGYSKQAIEYAKTINLTGRIELILHNGKDIQGIEYEIMKKAARIEVKKEMYDELRKEVEQKYQSRKDDHRADELHSAYDKLVIEYNMLNNEHAELRAKIEQEIYTEAKEHYEKIINSIQSRYLECSHGMIQLRDIFLNITDVYNVHPKYRIEAEDKVYTAFEHESFSPTPETMKRYHTAFENYRNGTLVIKAEIQRDEEGQRFYEKVKGLVGNRNKK